MDHDNTELVQLKDIIIKDRQRETPVTDKEIELLATSIRTVGQLVPILIDDDNTLIAGETRIKAFQLLGRTHILAIRKSNLSTFQKRLMELEENIRRYELPYADRLKAEKDLHEAYVNLHGKHQTLGGEGRNKWRLQDTAELLGVSTATVLNRLRLAEALEKDPSLGKFKSESQALSALNRQEELRSRQVMAILAGASQTIKPPVETDLTTPQFKSYSTQLATIYEASCLDLIPTLADNSIDCLITDPPWQVVFDEEFGSAPDTGLELTEKMLTLLYPKLKDGALCWLFCATKHLIRGAIFNIVLRTHYQYKDQIFIWYKKHVAHSSHPYRELKPDYEPCFCFSKGRARDFTTPCFAVHEAQVENKLHPANKPAAIISLLTDLSTVPGETIIDPFSGSGVTLSTASQMGRRTIGCEIDNIWYSTIVLNLSKETA